jgi:hypothetical protein
MLATGCGVRGARHLCYEKSLFFCVYVRVMEGYLYIETFLQYLQNIQISIKFSHRQYQPYRRDLVWRTVPLSAWLP